MSANTASTKVSNGFLSLLIAPQLTAMNIRLTELQLTVKGHALK
jgi:hypothetical protein